MAQENAITKLSADLERDLKSAQHRQGSSYVLGAMAMIERMNGTYYHALSC
jgi:hypothetical protein